MEKIGQRLQQADFLELATKFAKLQELMPYVEEFCRGYLELFPNKKPEAIQTNAFQYEMLLEDDGDEDSQLRDGMGKNIIDILNKFHRFMAPIEIKRAYRKMYAPNEDRKKLFKNIQASFRYLTKEKGLVIKNEEGNKYGLAEWTK